MFFPTDSSWQKIPVLTAVEVWTLNINSCLWPLICHSLSWCHSISPWLRDPETLRLLRLNTQETDILLNDDFLLTCLFRAKASENRNSLNHQKSIFYFPQTSCFLVLCVHFKKGNDILWWLFHCNWLFNVILICEHNSFTGKIFMYQGLLLLAFESYEYLVFFSLHIF